MGKYKEAIALYQKFIGRYPTDERLDRAYLNIVDAYRDDGDEQNALKWVSATEEAFKGKLPEAIAVFAEARIYLADSNWQNALASLDRLKTFADLGGINVPGGTNATEVDFLRAFSLEQLQRYDEAIETYLSIPDGRSEYYGARSTERLLLLANNENAKASVAQKVASLGADAKSRDSEKARKALQSLIRLTNKGGEREKLLEDLRAVYRALPAYEKVPSFKMLEIGRQELINAPVTESPENEHKRIADELLFLGLYDEAAPEVETNLNSPDAAKIRDSGYTLAVIYNRGDVANRAVAFVEPLWRSVPADYQIDLIPRGQLDLLYPAPYVDSLLKYAIPRDVDPRYILSIIRQESRYRPQVKSYAAARGLMQFVSTTADKIAVEVGRKNFREDELYDPPTAIFFGSQYLADLFKQFPGQPSAVAGSYNGGDDNIKRWLARSKSNEPDRYVPEIVFSQTKDYACKVMANYRMYRMIYEENLRPK
jgi:soluble lytic murein transglycosylase